jgi:hypothetical protein
MASVIARRALPLASVAAATRPLDVSLVRAGIVTDFPAFALRRDASGLHPDPDFDDVLTAPWPIGTLAVRARILVRPAQPLAVRILAADLAGLALAVDLDTAGRLGFAIGAGPIQFFSLGAADVVRLALTTDAAGALVAACNGEALDLVLPASPALTQTLSPRASGPEALIAVEALQAHDRALGPDDLIRQTQG